MALLFRRVKIVRRRVRHAHLRAAPARVAAALRGLAAVGVQALDAGHFAEHPAAFALRFDEQPEYRACAGRVGPALGLAARQDARHFAVVVFHHRLPHWPLTVRAHKLAFFIKQISERLSEEPLVFAHWVSRVLSALVDLEACGLQQKGEFFFGEVCFQGIGDRWYVGGFLGIGLTA